MANLGALARYRAMNEARNSGRHSTRTCPMGRSSQRGRRSNMPLAGGR